MFTPLTITSVRQGMIHATDPAPTDAEAERRYSARLFAIAARRRGLARLLGPLGWAVSAVRHRPLRRPADDAGYLSP